MKILSYLNTVPKEVNNIVIVAFSMWAIKVFFLNQIPAPLYFFYQFGELFEKLCSSVISSYIFYVFVTHWTAAKSKATIYPYVSEQVKLLVSECNAQIDDFNKAVNGNKLSFENLQLADLNAVLKQIQPNSNAPLLLNFSLNSNANWIEYMAFHNDRTKETIERLLKKINLLDADTVKFLSEIEDCCHFKLINTILSVYYQQKTIPQLGSCSDMSVYAESFFSYYEIIKKFRELEKTKLSKYSFEP